MRLNDCNKLFLMFYSIQSKFNPCFSYCFSFNGLKRGNKEVLHYFKTAKNRYDQMVDIGNIIKDI